MGKRVALCEVSDLPSVPAGRTGWPWTLASTHGGEKDTASDPPRISIVTPSFNQGSFLEETIRSVLLQGYPNLEYYVIDGGSTDDTIDVLRRYEHLLSGWVSEPDKGQSDAINKGIALCSGDLVNWLNADDYLLPDALWHLAGAVKNPDEQVVYCGDATIVDKTGRTIREQRVSVGDPPLLPFAHECTGGIQASHFVSRTAWDRAGGVNPSLAYTMDTELYHRCAAMGVGFRHVDHQIAAYRHHEETKTTGGWEQSINAKRHYWNWLLWQLGHEERLRYTPKVKRFIAGLYLSSITEGDSMGMRLRKAAGAVRSDPRMLVELRRIRRAVGAVLLRG